MLSKHTCATLVATLLLTACGKTGGNLLGADGGRCVAMTGAVVTTPRSSGCTSCAITNESKSIDADLATAATVNVSAKGAWAAIRATAKSGTVFKAGQMPGAFVSVTAASAAENSVTIETFLGGTLQENFKSDNLAWRDPSFFGFMISKPFDAVEIAVGSTQNPGAPEIAIAEFCSDYVDKRGRHFD